MMNSENIFRLVAFLLFVTAFTISGYYRRQADQGGGELDKSQGQGLLIVLRVSALLVLLPFLAYLINPAWVSWARWPLPEWVRWVGSAVGLATMPGFAWLFRSIGRNISPTQATRQDHQLVTSGPYRWIRHPLYTFGFIFYASLAVITSLWWLLAGLLILFPILAWRTPKEEANLIAQFGDEYKAYMARTGRYLPRLR